MLTSRWYPLRPHEKQRALWHSSARFKAVAAGRGSGKTELAKRYLVRCLPVRKPWANPIYMYTSPTRQQAKRIAWDDLKALTPREWIQDISETELTIKTIYGSSLICAGLDKPERIEGKQYSGVVIDESSDIKPKTFDLSIRPALSHHEGWVWRIGVPKRNGCGAAEFKECFDADSGWESFHWLSEDILTPEEIDVAREQLDPKDFAEQYAAQWCQSGGMAFYAFDKDTNVRRCTYDDTRTIIVGNDYNISPMTATLAHRYGDRIEVFDELFLRNSNTMEMLDVLYARYKNHKNSFTFVGDATARARKTAATKASFSDYLIIRQDERFAGAKILYPRSNPPILDRLAACNSMLRNSKGKVRIHIDPTCEHLIHDLEYRSIDSRGLPTDTGDLGHITDALGYLVHVFFPLHRIPHVESPVSILMGD